MEGELTETLTPSSITPRSRPLPIREDCWSEEATSTLVDAWGRRYLELNRGNLRQKDWQEVADNVNALHGHTKKTHRTDVQCKNRIDTIKKRYKAEKARVSSSNGVLSSWPFFDRLDMLIGSNFSGKNQPPPPMAKQSSPPVALPLPSHRRNPPFTAVALPQKRPFDDSNHFRKNYSAIAAAAAASLGGESYSDEEEVVAAESSEEDEEEEVEIEKEGEGIKRMARAIERFGEVYERVEEEKMRQMVDLEKRRMKFAKELEMERMKIFSETQIQLERLNNGK